MFSEMEIATTVLVLKLAHSKRLPLKVALVQDSEELAQRAWRQLALSRLESQAKDRQRKETLHIGT